MYYEGNKYIYKCPTLYCYIGGITKLHIPPPKPLRITYRNLKDFNQNEFKEQVSQITFHIFSIFDDISDQYWPRKWLFSEFLNEHAPLKHRAIKVEHVSYI